MALMQNTLAIHSMEQIDVFRKPSPGTLYFILIMQQQQFICMKNHIYNSQKLGHNLNAKQ